jgi:hypothetical protein
MPLRTIAAAVGKGEDGWQFWVVRTGIETLISCMHARQKIDIDDSTEMAAHAQKWPGKRSTVSTSQFGGIIFSDVSTWQWKVNTCAWQASADWVRYTVSFS